MAEEQNTFSESWYRVCDLNVSLRPQVRAHRQFFRGEKWVVLRDPYNNQFFRISPDAYQFVARLRPDRTVQEVWDDCIEDNPDGAPGQQDVIQMMAQLYHANLLQYNLPHDSIKLFERYKKRKQKEVRSKMLSIMFARIPLWDPDSFLKLCMPVVGKFISGFGVLLWLGTVGIAINVVIQNVDSLADQAEGILAPGNLPLLYIGMVIIKLLHEFGHAFACRRFGGEVHVMGVMLLVFTPIPYMDATASWGFRSRWKRLFVGAAGMIVEIFVAALAVFVWANTGEGTAWHALAYNMMFIASVSTLLFNINPLLRFDGYYMLSDLLDIPNLHQRANKQLRHLVERYAFGVKKSWSPASTRKESMLLLTFGILSGIYRFFVFAMILIFVADRFLLLGMIMLAVCVISWIFVPLGKLLNYLGSNPKLERSRGRAITVVSSVTAMAFAALYYIPMPNSFRAPGIVEAEDRLEVVNETNGIAAEILAQSGGFVELGQPLIQMENRELQLERAIGEAQLRQAEGIKRRALTSQAVDLKPIEANIAAIQKHLAHIDTQRGVLTVRAKQQGTWVAPDIDDHAGRWMARGTMLGAVIDDNAHFFYAIVPQQQAKRIFSAERPGRAEVKLFGQAGNSILVDRIEVIPAEQTRLRSATLGWLAGGEIEVDMSDPSGLKTAEPFYEVRAILADQNKVPLYHGRSGRIRFELDPEPLLIQWGRKFRQLIQQRYQI